VCWYGRRLIYWWDGGGEDEKRLIVMFTTMYSELSLVPGDDHVAIPTSGKGHPLLRVCLVGEVRVAHNTGRSAAYGCARSCAL
jgi:hypothetical protein